MTPLLFIGIAVVGGLGAAARFMLDVVIRSRVSSSLPVGTIAINLLGSLLIGLVAGMVGGVFATPTFLILGTGFLGGFTTFSTASVETVRMLQERKYARAATYGFGTVVTAVVLAGIGMWVGNAMFI